MWPDDCCSSWYQILPPEHSPFPLGVVLKCLNPPYIHLVYMRFRAPLNQQTMPAAEP